MKHIFVTVAALTIALLCTVTFLRASVFQDSVTLYRDVSSKSPNKARPHNNFGDALKRAGRFDEARVALERALALDPDYPDALNNLATIYTHDRKHDEALRLLVAALELQPGHIQARHNLAMAYFESGMLQDAALQYRMIVLLAPHSREAAFARTMLAMIGAMRSPP